MPDKDKLYRREGSDNWWIDIKVKGRRRIRRSAGTSDRKKAKALAIKIEAQEWDRLIKGDPATLTFAEAVTMYLAAGRNDQYLTPIVLHFKDRKVADITPEDIREAGPAIYPLAQGQTWNRQVITPARAVINYAAEKRKASFIRVKRHLETPKVRARVPDDWMKRFIAAALATKLYKAAAYKVATLHLFRRVTGARISQALSLHWKEDIDLQAGTAKIPACKGHEERLADLTPDLIAMMANLPRNKEGLVFTYKSRFGVDGPTKRICTEAGLPYISTHGTGRRAFFTAMMRKNVDPKTAGELGGLKSTRLLIEVYTEARRDPGIVNDVFREVAGTFESQPVPVVLKKNRKNK